MQKRCTFYKSLSQNLLYIIISSMFVLSNHILQRYLLHCLFIMCTI